jgi:hypothetical protein
VGDENANRITDQGKKTHNRSCVNHWMLIALPLIYFPRSKRHRGRHRHRNSDPGGPWPRDLRHSYNSRGVRADRLARRAGNTRRRTALPAARAGGRAARQETTRRGASTLVPRGQRTPVADVARRPSSCHKEGYPNANQS